MTKDPKFTPMSDDEKRQFRNDPLTRGKRKHTDLSQEELADLKRDRSRHYREHGTGNMLSPGTNTLKPGEYRVVNKSENRTGSGKAAWAFKKWVPLEKRVKFNKKRKKK